MIDALIVVASSCSNRCEKPARLIWQPAEIEGSRITKENPSGLPPSTQYFMEAETALLQWTYADTVYLIRI